MPRKKKYLNKSSRKKADRRCKFCGEEEYCTLDLHYIARFSGRPEGSPPLQ